MAGAKSCSAPLTVDNIRTELNLPAPTPHTLRFLRTILGLDVWEKHGTVPAATKEVSKRPTRARNPAPAASKRCRNAPPKVPIHESSDGKGPRLSSADRRKIATEVFNSTLKQLGQAAKAEQVASRSRITKTTPLRLPSVQRALQERSPNREGKKHAIPQKKAAVQSESLDWRVVADMSHSALHYLRGCEDTDHVQGKTHETGLENASLILLDRTITLGLVAQAQCQLYEVYHRYLEEKTTQVHSTVGEANIARHLLARADAVDQASTFGFTTSMQSQGLRLALLLGPKAITKELVHALQLETVGSPAWMSMQGFQKGLHSSEQAGLQLRTISLALSKLYTLGLKPDGHAVSQEDLFDLFCLALRLKFESWTRLGHSPDPESEVWRHFHLAVKRLFAAKTSSQTAITSVVRYLRSFQRLLKLAGCDDSIPHGLAESLLQPTPSIHPQPEILTLAEEQIASTDAVTSLIFCCYSSASRLKFFPQDSEAALRAIERTTAAFIQTRFPTAAHLQRLLIYTAYLRKAALEVMMVVERKRKEPGEDPATANLQRAIVNLMYTSSGVLCRQIQATVSDIEPGPGKARPEVFLTTLIKNIEAVLSTEKCSVTRTPEMEELACDSLRSCSAVIDFLLADSSGLLSTSTLSAAVGQLKVRLSNVFWVRFLELVQQRRKLSEQAATLELSVKGIPGLPFVDQKAAYLGLKYEKLTTCYLEMGDHAMAKSMLQKAIDFNIKEGTLSEVVELLLNGRFDSAWSQPNSNCKSLARNLVTHARLTLNSSVPAGSHDLFYDNPSLPPIHRAVLLEKQIYAVAEKDLPDHQLSFWKAQVEFVFQLLGEPQYHVYKLKFANSLMHSALRKRTPVLDFLADAAHVWLRPDSDQKIGGNTFLRAFEPGCRSLFTLQFGFLTGRITKHALQENVKRLSDIIRPCRTKADVEQVLADIENTILPLQLSVEYADIFDDSDIALMALKALYHVMELGLQSAELSKANLLLRIGRAHQSLQDICSAEKAFFAAEKMLGLEEAHGLSEVEFALDYSEHFIDIDNVELCLNWLDRARHAWDNRDRADASPSNKSRLREQTALCKAAYLVSRLAFNRGQLSEATTCGRQAAKIAGGIWLSIEKAWTSDAPSSQRISADGDLESLSLGLSKLNLSSQHSPWLRANAVGSWPQIRLYCSVFSNLAALNAHCGLYQGAAWLYEEALKVARKAGRSVLEASLLSNVALLHARAGQNEKAQKGLDDLSAGGHENIPRLNQALICINQADTHLLLGDPSSAERCFVEARQHLNAEAIRSNCTQAGEVAKKKPSKTAVRPPARKTTVKPRSKTAPAIAKSTESKAGSSILSSELRTLHESLAALQAKLQLFKCPRASGFETGPGSMADGDLVNPRKSMTDALGLVQTALKLFSEDAENNVLAETAMALPVRYRSARKSGRVSFVPEGALLVRMAKPTELSKKPRQKGADQVKIKDGKALLLEAYHILSTVNDCPQGRISSDIIHTVHKIMTQISLLSTALGQPFVTSSLELVLDKLCPMDLARARERLVTLSEQATAEMSDIQSWPRLQGDDVSQASEDVDMDLDLLPASWAIVAFGLNEDRSELLVSRLSTGRSPFIVRIPLTRPDSSDAETEDLDFDSAKGELLQIIAKANSSAHDSRGSSADKSVRRSWYDERKALDQQLATLLDNIENVWFGGFRGLLAAPDTDEAALLKFGQSFARTLNRHLPSRQKSSKAAGPKVELHSHVLELFVTLGHPRQAELEDAITDLLYFVTDILQFNGERNAYDEIDFDAMVVEVLDALHAYHDEKSRRTKSTQSSHVILVLDKELQAFPWESLSCLKGQAVSRMPSLGAVWERLQAIRQQATQSDGYVVPVTGGTYILNPASDLTSTQEMFGEVFGSQLSQFKAIVNRAPQEKEFEDALHGGPLMLYFGHGGGAQYIRGGRIRRLDKCAVTLLMGCSSAKLTECGVYEPYGMPWNYLNGGSPAVVGNLWDVTDRDIDRFAMKLMSEWGLVEVKDEPKTANKEGRGKAEREREKQSVKKRGLVSLDQALAGARDECLLKYLNGAAPVMYGVPVFLE
ncbi:hypothetical protein A1O3_03980 [Capronia epimyces CBS 606.96]|uniref:separase n=1 Tax=Capronia epimyces CBS 606.96 TaxID=1182542 RepID=W9Y3F3_9EURO|nr:uncharacterized protein A1O3_03980 [Capronia epimyces CBS 606.96]EXJ87023.1 hypothetical protein A1O3_03980 [Capronia epimyces CBS 606.96]